MSKISKLCVTLAASGNYTWDGSTFGAHVTITTSSIQTRLDQIYDNELPHINPATGLTSVQPVNTIRLAAGKDSDTEQLPVLAGALLCTRSVLFIKRKTAWRTKK